MPNSDRVVLALGGAGTVGSGVVKALLDKGFKVAVISRDNGRLERLRSSVSAGTKDNLTTIVGDVGTEDGAEAAKQALLKVVGKVIETLLLSTFVSWKAFFPLVRDDPNCTYTFITGGAGEKLLMPGTGFLTVGAASTLAFCQVLREEYPEVSCKLNQLKINAGVAPPERMAPGFLNHLELGEGIAALVERCTTSHTVLTISCPADLKTVLLEGDL
ncbi:hypothetical protein NHX12_002545 [Muraenolepis orangiensis]|uniref:Uncharacterized protein n=1 Tax=Muraenolepis orangiensis TaxID=630683 RepID=A0A9Q0DX34_9TELE|nr:hypothetical protein NHX12_002545 [Muraenolepis orangiensis]